MIFENQNTTAFASPYLGKKNSAMSKKKFDSALPVKVSPKSPRRNQEDKRLLLENTPLDLSKMVKRPSATPSVEQSTSFLKPKSASRGFKKNKGFSKNFMKILYKIVFENQNTTPFALPYLGNNKSAMSGKILESALSLKVSSKSPLRNQEDERVLLEETTPLDLRKKMKRPPATPSVEPSTSFPKPKRASRGLVYLKEEADCGNFEDNGDVFDCRNMRMSSRHAKDVVIDKCKNKSDAIIENCKNAIIEECKNKNGSEVVESVDGESIEVGAVAESVKRQNVEELDVVEGVEGQSVELGDVVESVKKVEKRDEVESVVGQNVEQWYVVESVEGQSVEVGDVVESVKRQNVKERDVVESLEGQNIEEWYVVESVEGQSVEVGDVVESAEGQNVEEWYVVESVEGQIVEVGDVIESVEGQSVEVGDVVESVEGQSVEVGDVVESVEGPDVEEGDVRESVEEQGLEQNVVSPEYANLTEFSWTDDYSTFAVQEEIYFRTPGTPAFASQDPEEIFMSIWDESIMSEIVRETNKYAWQIIASYSEVDCIIPEWLHTWFESTIDEMYRYFAVLIFMSMGSNARVKDYWTTCVTGMPEFRKLMSWDRFVLLTRFLHFTDNSDIKPNLSAHQKKIAKIRPILEHCNRKFSELYTPNKYLNLDESLLLTKGRLSWDQAIGTKAAQIGLKTYELCEAETGYLLKCLLYEGKGSTMLEESMNVTAKIVLELMDGYLDVGHCLVMDNWYDQLSLARFLKRRRTDVMGTMNPRRTHVPDVIKHAASDPSARRGEHTARHCGDLSLVTWKDVKQVTALSTFHTDTMVLERGAEKPLVITEYNKYMGGVDSKDQQLSIYPMERRGKRWYIKVFERFLNTSILNSFIIYRKNPSTKLLSHRDFRHQVASRLLEKFPAANLPSISPITKMHLQRDATRLSPGEHFPKHMEKVNNEFQQKRCVRCTAAGRRTMVTLLCSFCEVALCIGECWLQYHSLRNLH